MIIEIGDNLSHSKPIEYEVDSNGCWNIISHVKDKDGYGLVVRYINGVKYDKAHRVSYQHHYRDLESGELVRHKCNNPSCINPKHLIKGSHEENMDDRLKAGNYHGEKNGKAKLNREIVLNINKMINDGFSDFEIMEHIEVDVKRSTIQDIRHGRTWSHITRRDT